MGNFKIFVNFKTYPQGTGERAVELARVCGEVSKELKVSEVSKESEVQIIPVVQIADVFRIKQEVDIPIWVQHLDWQEQGQFTGWVNLEAVVKAGASGTLLNHSEHQMPPGTIKHVLDRVQSSKACPELVEGFKVQSFETMVCCKTLGQMERLVKLKPDFIGYEIEELIGGKISITDLDPKAIKHAIEICGNIPLVVGAGINKMEDMQKTRELGAKGVLISSAVVLAERPKEKLNALLRLPKKEEI